ncbi:unnamed protein product [Oikopleura dioica]|uniref:C2H2-type domain-containing protein n=1 Tax=Oikopleura dioica TaxID=34765 RepID=E4XB88_OIKDI|nr:unnamed protein product [Oikopleura dioica]
MTDTQPANISMYQDFLMKFAQQQQSPLQKNLLQSNPLLHQMQQQMQRERVNNNERNSLGENSAESVSPVSSGAPATSRDLLNALAEQKFPTLLKQETPKTPRRNDQKEQHKCPKCDYTTPWKSSIATHMKLKHSNERPWRCDICSKAYKLKHHLKAHMEGSHASEKPYQCKLCVFSCIDSRTLNKHMFNKHGRQNPLKHGQGMLGGAGGPMRGRVLPNMLPMSRPYDPTGYSSNPWARKDMPLGRLPNHLAGLNPALMQNQMEQNQMLNPLTSDPALLMAQIQKNQEMFAAAQAQENALNNPMLTPNSMLLQLAASMQRQLQSRIQQQVQTSMSSPMPATSPHLTTPFSTAQIAPPSPVTEAVVEEVHSNAGSTSDQAPPQIVVKAELLGDEPSPASPAIVSTENNDINGNENVEIPPPALTPRSTTSGQEVVVEPASPAMGEETGKLQIADQTIATEASEAVETRSISVKSERLDDSACRPKSTHSAHSAHSNNSTNLRKRKLEDPGIGHMMSEQLLQQRLAQAARPSIPFPFGLSQFQARDRRPSNGSSDELSPPAARAALGAQMHASMSLQRSMQGGDFFNQLAQLQQLVGANQNAQMQQLRCEHCQITFPDPIMYMAHMDMHKNPAIHAFQCSRCSHICKDRTEFFLHWRNNECNN